MATLATIATVAAPIIGLAGSAISARGTLAAGRAQQQALNYQAKESDVRAKEERSAAQQTALQYKRQAKLALSALQARGAASGFSANDDSTQDLAGEIARYGTLQERMAQFGGDSRAAGFRRQGQGLRLSGGAAVKGSQYGAAGTLINGFSRFAQGVGGTGGTSGRYY